MRVLAEFERRFSGRMLVICPVYWERPTLYLMLVSCWRDASCGQEGMYGVDKSETKLGASSRCLSTLTLLSFTSNPTFPLLHQGGK